jgi:myo-inositol catabolism protein IolC
MQELSALLDVDVWKLEHLGAQANYAEAVEVAASSGGECILLGAGASADQVDEWLSIAARSGFTGFAIGRSIWWQALRDLLASKTSQDDAVSLVAASYTRFVTTFRNASTHRDSASVAGAF